MTEKNVENEQLKSDVEKLQQRLKALENSGTSISLLKEKELLENENRNMRTTLEEAEKKVRFLIVNTFIILIFVLDSGIPTTSGN